MLKAIIFDMDGVLIDSPRYNGEAARIVWEKHGIKINEKDRKKNLGMSLKDQITLTKKKHGIKKDIDVLKFSKDALEIQVKLMKHLLVPNKKVLNIIKQAKSEKIKVAVATASTRFRAKKILLLLGIFKKIDLLVAADDVKTHKPSPEVYLKTARLLEVKPSECIVFEDSINGVAAAKNAGIKVIGFKTKFFSKKDMLKTGASEVIKDFSEVKLDKLKRLTDEKRRSKKR